jgi:SAM-dependent methyltransferase
MDTVVNPIPEPEWTLYQPLVGHTMLELGNKQTRGVSYKDYFESRGIAHTSIDWNGLQGALVMDLRTRLDLGQFDMVTNIGTTEHVSEQAPVWDNVHRALKVGGVLISTTPAEGNWWWHGEWYPRPAFYEQMAERNGYVVDRLFIEKEHPIQMVFTRLTKVKDVPFTQPDANTLYHNLRRPR